MPRIELEPWPQYVSEVPIRTTFPIDAMPLSKSGHVRVDTQIDLANGKQWVSTFLDIVGPTHSPQWMVTHRDCRRVKDICEEEVDAIS